MSLTEKEVVPDDELVVCDIGFGVLDFTVGGNPDVLAKITYGTQLIVNDPSGTLEINVDTIVTYTDRGLRIGAHIVPILPEGLTATVI